MKPTKLTNISSEKSSNKNKTVIVSTDIEVIEPTNYEQNHIQQQYWNWLEENEYYHLAYSRY